MSVARPPVVYIHGIGNKPPAAILKAQWDAALGGAASPSGSRMAYWVNRHRYPAASEGIARGGDLVSVDLPGPLARLCVDRPSEHGAELVRGLTEPGVVPARRRVLALIGERMLSRHAASAGVAGPDDRVLPLPASMRGWIARQLTRLFLADAYDFLFDEAERARMRAVLTGAVGDARSVVIVAHSLGSLIAYDWLSSPAAHGVEVPLLVTFGSPLGLLEVQDLMRGWLGVPALSAPRRVERWLNVADRLDPVAVDATVADDLGTPGRIVDRASIGLNEDAPWHPHSATGYLKSAAVREALALSC